MDGRTVKELSVEGLLHRIQPSKHFVYSVKVTWSDGMVNIVYRRYKQFLDLQKQLLDAFRIEKESIPTLRVKSPNCPRTALKNVDEIAAFVETLINLPSSISSCDLVLGFFTLTEQDIGSNNQKEKAKRKKVTLEKTSKKQTKSHKNNGKRSRFTRRMKTIKAGLISGPIVFEQYTVVEAYKKGNKNDISLTEGQMVEVIEKRDNGWWFVEADEQLGWAPASFLQNTDFDGADDFIITRFPRGHGEMYMTTKSYKATMQDELSFDVGVNLQIVERNYGGWWRAIYLGKEGYVPAAYLNKIGRYRHSVLQRNTKERKISQVVSRLDGVIMEEPDEENASVHSSLEDTVQMRNLRSKRPYASTTELQNQTNSNPHWRDSLPPFPVSCSAPGTPERTVRHRTLPLSVNFMASTGNKDEACVNGRLERAFSTSGSELNSTSSSDDTSLSSLSKHPPELAQTGENSTSSLAEAVYQIHDEDRLGSGVNNQKDDMFEGDSIVHGDDDGNDGNHDNDDDGDGDGDGHGGGSGSGDGDDDDDDDDVDNDDDVDDDDDDDVDDDVDDVVDVDDDVDDDEYDETNILSFTDLPSPPRLPLKHRQQARKQAKTSDRYHDGQGREVLQFSNTNFAIESFPNTIHESEEYSSDDDEEGKIEISGLLDNPPQTQYQLTYQVIASYEGDESMNELTLAEGEIVHVIDKRANGWWVVSSDHQIGWAPCTYLKPIEQQVLPETQTNADNCIDTKL